MEEGGPIPIEQGRAVMCAVLCAEHRESPRRRDTRLCRSENLAFLRRFEDQLKQLARSVRDLLARFFRLFAQVHLAEPLAQELGCAPSNSRRTSCASPRRWAGHAAVARGLTRTEEYQHAVPLLLGHALQRCRSSKTLEPSAP